MTWSQNKTIETIKYSDFKNIVINKNIQLIDVRSSKEYNDGFIENAINISIKNKKYFKSEALKLHKNKPVYVYCYSGYRSLKASRNLKKLGFTTIFNFNAGWKKWSQNID